jgi:hypothetical protein
MALSVSQWTFALLPFLLLLAALFWGAPAIALVSELIGTMSGKPFPVRVARQISRLGVRGHALVWAAVLAAGAMLMGHAFRQSEFAAANRLLFAVTAALPFFGSLALVAYDLGWKSAKERRAVHVLLGCVANVAVKCGYWGLVALGLLSFRGIPLESPAFLPPWGSSLWPLTALWLPMALGLTAGGGLVYLLLRRNTDDWGRDYYRFAAPFLGKWHIAMGMVTLGVTGWLFVSLKGVYNLHLPQIFYAGAAATACLVLAMALALAVCLAENPMRHKGSMLAVTLFSMLHAGLMAVAILETLNRYVPGWSVPTFMPQLLRLVM